MLRAIDVYAGFITEVLQVTTRSRPCLFGYLVLGTVEDGSADPGRTVTIR